MNKFFPDEVLQIPNATVGTEDAAQYMLRNGRKQYNLCGEFCVAYCLQDNTGYKNIDTFLDYWQAKSLSWYNSVFKSGLGRTTGLWDLKEMIKDYGEEKLAGQIDKTQRQPVIFQGLLEECQLIVGVQIDYTGYLVKEGIPHWVVLEAIDIVRDPLAICTIYNPFTNAMEPYSWREFNVAMGVYKQGLLVTR